MQNEFLESNKQPAGSLLGIGIDGEVRNKMQTVITWSKITAVGGFVNLGLNFLSSIITFSKSASRDNSFLAITTIVSLAISFFLNFFLFQFSKNLRASLENESQESFNVAAAQLKSYMRMLGILLAMSLILIIISYGYVFTVSRGFKNI